MLRTSVHEYRCSMSECERLNRVRGIENITLSLSDEEHTLYLYAYHLPPNYLTALNSAAVQHYCLIINIIHIQRQEKS
jgi:hypothetical protein